MSATKNIIKPKYIDPLGVRRSLETKAGKVDYYSLPELQAKGFANIETLPVSIKILLEAVLRQIDNFVVEENHVKEVANWKAVSVKDSELPFKPARVVMQDFTGVPGVVDLAAMRDAMKALGKDPQVINPELPVDLVVDHSVQLDKSGSKDSLQYNVDLEFSRNNERYEFLRWGSQAFSNFQVVPPSTGIIHQVNLEYLAKVVQTREDADGKLVAYPDSLVGTDSHTTMINGLGILGWGVGGIEAEAVMLGQPVYMLTPDVVGFKLTGTLSKQATATDLVLTIVEQLRKFGVVDKFVEFYGPGVAQLSLADRATIANMAPEYGATMGFFAVDDETLNYLRMTGRDEKLIDLVEKYCKAQGIFRTAESKDPIFSANLELDMSLVVPCISGPKRPQDRIVLENNKSQFHKDLKKYFSIDVSTDSANTVSAAIGKGESYAKQKSPARIPLYEASKTAVTTQGKNAELTHGSVVIASITSCTNTSNPSVILGAGLLAQKAVAKGLTIKPYVKTSLAPGSRVVARYLDLAGLTVPLDKLGFQVAGFGCATCIGNSGPIDEELSKKINEKQLVATAVLSGNRNFEGRIHPDVKANYLASPPLVVAFAIAGTVDIDFDVEPLGHDAAGQPVYLNDIWPSHEEVNTAMKNAVTRALFQDEYNNVGGKNEQWNKIQISAGDLYPWNAASTYIRKPTFFEGMSLQSNDLQPIENARVLAILGDSVTTDHISPAGNISKISPAAKWLNDHKVEQVDFNSYGSRRGNHEVMMRGTFANTRIRNKMVEGKEGGYSLHVPTGEQGSIYDVAVKYANQKTPLIILAGKEYGTGSSRDWAAKGTFLLGIKAVIAESFERIHRSNLIGMGVLPLQFKNGESAGSLGLDGSEILSIKGLNNSLKPKTEMTVEAKKSDGKIVSFTVLNRVDTPVEVEYLKNNGILQTVLRKFASL